MTKQYKLVILIGRFQPVHKAHLINFREAFNIADKVQIFVGSSFQSRTFKNPFTFAEREDMIRTMLIKDEYSTADFTISPLRDHRYSNNAWIQQVQALVKANFGHLDNSEIAIAGYDKDDSSWYNHAFPAWNFIPLPGYSQTGSHPIDATKIRELLFENNLDFISNAVTTNVFNTLVAFTTSDEYKTLVADYGYIKKYKQAWSVAPFPPTFVTVDAVVIQGGHILLIQRGGHPGKGLWALPGGFLNQKESTVDAMIRELLEETRIKVPEIVLRKAVTYEKLFDAPDRSLRGRTITQAFLIELDGGKGDLPRVKAADDARNAKWFTLAEVKAMSDKLFEDHAHIIDVMVGRAK
jgi:bifunctional NMN adenylyltransferase/nudix hydrolase